MKIERRFRVRDAQIKAMEAMFQLSEAVEAGNLSISDLADVVRLCVAGGHETMELHLAMASNAVHLISRENEP